MNGIPMSSMDMFANIAAGHHLQIRDKLVKPGILNLPRRYITLEKYSKKSEFIPNSKIYSKTTLYQELLKIKKVHAEFMRNLAPDITSLRKVLMLRHFDWREQTSMDLEDFGGHTVAGGGMWQQITIPHYGPPCGRAATYYRTTFKLSKSFLKESVFVCFKGVDYKSHVFINGLYIGSHEGFFSPFEFDITSVVKLGGNTMVVKVENDATCMGNPPIAGTSYDGDKIYAATGCGWDDPKVGWHHCPPGMGIYQDVFIESRARIHISDIFVRPLVKQNTAEAWLEIYNCNIGSQRLMIELSVYGQNFGGTVFKNKTYVLKTDCMAGIGDMPKPDSTGEVELLAGPGINYFKLPFDMPAPRLWEPNNPWLYQVQAKLLDGNGKVIDVAKRQFGMRSFEMDTQNSPKGKIFLNGRQIRLRGANTMGHEQQCVIKKDWNQLINDILIAKICNLNFLRLTQRPVQEEIYNYCDMLGMMTQTDLPLFGCLRRNQFHEAVRQADEMEHLIRSHPCNIMVSYINEPFPNGLNRPHRHLVRSELNDFFKSADIVIRRNNPERVIKAVDGDYDPPGPGLPDNHCYPGWYTGHGIDLGKLHKGFWQLVKPNWYYGCGEFGAEGLDFGEVMQKYYPKEWLPQGEDQTEWCPESIIGCQTGRFHYMWFDAQHTLDDWVHASQEHQRWVIRLMAEAFRRDARMTSFAVHLLIDAWPAGWMKALMDVDRNPKPAYFAYRKALMPLLVSLRTDRHAFFSKEQILLEVWICNDKDISYKNINVHLQIVIDGRVTSTGKFKANVPACSSKFQRFLRFRTPEVSSRTKITVQAALIDFKGKILNDNEAELSVFPKTTDCVKKEAYIIGDKKGESARLARTLGLKTDFTKPSMRNGLILIDDLRLFEKSKEKILKLVRNGALAVFLKLPIGEYKIGTSRVNVSKCEMGPRHFISRKTGHQLARDFEPNDFRFWFDVDMGYVSPFLHTTFIAPEFTPILITGNPDQNNAWVPTLAAAEQKFGNGYIRICQVDLANRTTANPVAMIFAARLLGLYSECHRAI